MSQLVKATFTKPWRGFKVGDEIEVTPEWKEQMREFFDLKKPKKAKKPETPSE